MGTSKRAEGKTPSRHRFRLVGFVLLLVVAAALLGLWHLSREIEDRFAGRRWSIPSKVFSDTTLLYSGQTFPRRRLEAKLARLGYRPVTHPPERHGEIRSAGSRLDIFLRDFLTPQRSGRGFPARLTFRQDRIESITRLDTGAPLPLLEIEPEELMLFFGKKREDRRLVSLQAVPRQLVDAILAAEDARFFQHPGMDLRGILRALLRNIRHGALREGGSTITQQLAKNYFLTPEKTLSRKFKELLIALLMEAQYSKDEILEIYLNEIYLGQKGSVSVNGVGEAAFFYFGKPVPELSLSEAATLAGLIKAPKPEKTKPEKTKPEEPKPEEPKPAGRFPFVLNNVKLTGGSLELEDRAVAGGRTQTLKNLEIDLPCLSSLPAEADREVELRVSLVFNGAPLSLTAKIKPVIGDLTASLQLILRQLSLPPLSGYAPQAPPVELASGDLSLDPERRFRQPADQRPGVHVRAFARLASPGRLW